MEFKWKSRMGSQHPELARPGMPGASWWFDAPGTRAAFVPHPLPLCRLVLLHAIARVEALVQLWALDLSSDNTLIVEPGTASDHVTDTLCFPAPYPGHTAPGLSAAWRPAPQCPSQPRAPVETQVLGGDGLLVPGCQPLMERVRSTTHGDKPCGAPPPRFFFWTVDERVPASPLWQSWLASNTCELWPDHGQLTNTWLKWRSGPARHKELLKGTDSCSDSSFTCASSSPSTHRDLSMTSSRSSHLFWRCQKVAQMATPMSWKAHQALDLPTRSEAPGKPANRVQQLLSAAQREAISCGRAPFEAGGPAFCRYSTMSPETSGRLASLCGT